VSKVDEFSVVPEDVVIVGAPIAATPPAIKSIWSRLHTFKASRFSDGCSVCGQSRQHGRHTTEMPYTGPAISEDSYLMQLVDIQAGFIGGFRYYLGKGKIEKVMDLIDRFDKRTETLNRNYLRSNGFTTEECKKVGY
jgi:hypothetical protein